MLIVFFQQINQIFQFNFLLKIKNGFVKPFLKNSPLLSNNTRSQNQPSTYIPNGGFWICNTKKISQN